VLASLGIECLGQGGAIFWADAAGGATSVIRKSDLDGSNTQVLIPTGVSHPRGMALDAWAGQIYWNDEGSGYIISAALSGNGPHNNVAAISPASGGVAFDDFGRKLYWTDAGTGEIKCCDPNGANVQTLVSSLVYPVAIAVDSMNGRMYWSDFGTAKIQRASLDGTGQMDVVTGLTGDCAGIAIDPIVGKMYWIEGASNGAIREANLDGTSPATLYPGVEVGTCLALDRVHGTLYWSQSTAPAIGIYSLNLNGGGNQPVVPAALAGFPWGIVVSNGSTPSEYCTAKMNSLGCMPQIGFVGYPTLSGPDNFSITASNVLNNKSGMLLWSGAPANTPFHGGTLCLSSPIIRTSLQPSNGNPAPANDCSGTYSFLFSQAYMSAHFLAPGSTVCAQYWSRDPGFVIPDNIGLTDALRFVIAP
jgi:hypothetical protein